MSSTSKSIREKFPASKCAAFTRFYAFKNCHFCNISPIVSIRWSNNAPSEGAAAAVNGVLTVHQFYKTT